MVRHHAAGIEIAQAAVARADTEQVRTLCENIIRGQFAEIETMQGMLAQRGQEPEPLSDSMAPMDHTADPAASPTS